MHIPDSETVIIFNRNGMGTAEPALCEKLAATYLRLLVENEITPAVICLYAEGVWLVAEGSPVLEELTRLESLGTRLIVCSTCLNYYNLQSKLRVGIVGGMTDILEAQRRAGKVITL